MPECDVCGNEYPHTMTIEIGSGADATVGIFDSFECAISALAPRCAHCARQLGVTDVADRSETTNSAFWNQTAPAGGE